MALTVIVRDVTFGTEAGVPFANDRVFDVMLAMPEGMQHTGSARSPQRPVSRAMPWRAVHRGSAND